MDALKRYVRVMETLYLRPEVAPKTLVRARAILQLMEGQSLDHVAAVSGLPRRFLMVWSNSIGADGFYSWLKKQEPREERVQRARAGIAQMLLGALAEEHFEGLAAQVLGEKDARIEDDRVGRTDTDYRLLDSERRPICRFNVKFHGTLFRESKEYVGLETTDCFALATYKIHGALRRQEEERLPYVFLIISGRSSRARRLSSRSRTSWHGWRRYPIARPKRELSPS